MLNALIIDDEELACKLLENYIDRLDHVTVKGTFQNPLEALPMLKEETIDVVFLDIQMPQLRGTEFARLLSSNTKVIFTTAYAEYALEGFELSACDYLLKPITFDRFLQALNKVSQLETNDRVQTITVKSGYDYYKLAYADIIYIESESEYVFFHTPHNKIISLMSLKQLVKDLPKEQFSRVHRSYIVNINHVKALKGKQLLVGNNSIPIGNQYYQEVKEKIFS